MTASRHTSYGHQLAGIFRELLLPRTDAGVLAQVVAAAIVYGLAVVLVRRDRDLLWLVGGLATITFAFFGLRALH